jgi:hypothetical protein
VVVVQAIHQARHRHKETTAVQVAQAVLHWALVAVVAQAL